MSPSLTLKNFKVLTPWQFRYVHNSPISSVTSFACKSTLWRTEMVGMTAYLNRVVFVAVYYKNIWQSKSFPFVRTLSSCVESSRLSKLYQLSQELFYANGTVYDQLLILNDKFEVDKTLLEEQGLVRSCSYYFYSLINSSVAVLCGNMGGPTSLNEFGNGCYLLPSFDLEPR